jgi:hypothetical protein
MKIPAALIALLFLAALLPLTSVQGVAAGESTKAAPCTAPVHHEFDFWIGDWVVTENGRHQSHRPPA